MQLLDKYLDYWPVLAASLLFLILGLCWRISSARAMELTPKKPDWVKRYRTGGFPFRQVLPAHPQLRFLALLLVILLAVAFAAAQLANTSMTYLNTPDYLFNSSYGLFRMILFAIGAVCVYCLLNTLYNSVWVSLPGALIFAASVARGHAESCFLALSLLFLLLYLRAEKPGFPSELLYLCAILALAPMIALRPALVWLVLCFPPVHWYKLNSQRRNRQLSGGALFLALLIALLCWALAFALTVLLRRYLLFGFRFKAIGHLLEPARFCTACSQLLREFSGNLFKAPTRGMTLDLMVDAPLFGFGLWGCCSAWTLAKERRDARGVFSLVTLAALLIVWLLTGRYILTLGLTLTTACILRDADLGKKRGSVVLMTVLAILWYLGIQAAGWYFQLTKGLLERLV